MGRRLRARGSRRPGRLPTLTWAIRLNNASRWHSAAWLQSIASHCVQTWTVCLKLSWRGCAPDSKAACGMLKSVPLALKGSFHTDDYHADTITLMCQLKILEKSQLSEEQLSYIDERLREPDHKDDAGPRKVWDIYQNHLYAVVRTDDDVIVGLAEASGRPASSPGWWIDHKFRKQKLGYGLVEALAEYLIQDGVEKILPLHLEGKCQCASRKLAKRFRERFSELKKRKNL